MVPGYVENDFIPVCAILLNAIPCWKEKYLLAVHSLSFVAFIDKIALHCKRFVTKLTFLLPETSLL